LLALLVLSACEASKDDAAAPVKMLVAANAAKDQAMVTGDRSALENFYAAGYEVIDDDGNVHDKRAQVEFITKSIDLLDARSDDVRVSMLGKNVALVTGRMNGRYRQSGNEKSFAERYTSIWVNEDSQWRVRHEHSSTIETTR